MSDVKLRPISEAPRDGRDVLTVYWVSGSHPSQAYVAAYHKSDIADFYSGWRAPNRTVHATHFIDFGDMDSPPATEGTTK